MDGCAGGRVYGVVRLVRACVRACVHSYDGCAVGMRSCLRCPVVRRCSGSDALLDTGGAALLLYKQSSLRSSLHSAPERLYPILLV